MDLSSNFALTLWYLHDADREASHQVPHQVSLDLVFLHDANERQQGAQDAHGALHRPPVLVADHPQPLAGGLEPPGASIIVLHQVGLGEHRALHAKLYPLPQPLHGDLVTGVVDCELRQGPARQLGHCQRLEGILTGSGIRGFLVAVHG